MKKLLAFLFLTAIISWMVIPCSGAEQPSDNEVPQDSMLTVIGWFCKHDTVVYQIENSKWKFKDGDTTKTAGLSTQVMVTVTDSTETGYKMSYTILDMQCDSVFSKDAAAIQEKIVSWLGNRMIGTTINFETDEYGRIVKYDNLNKLKKQAKNTFKAAIKELKKQSWMKTFDELGIDFEEYTKNVNTDLLIQSYTKDLEHLFVCHGGSYALGELFENEDATEDQYASTQYTSAQIDDEGYYNISAGVRTIIPISDVKALVAALIEMAKDQAVKENFEENFDSEVNIEECAKESNFSISYLPNGWPFDVREQEYTEAGNNGEEKFTHIYLVAYSFNNY